MAPPEPSDLAAELAMSSPLFHGSGTVRWNASPATLRSIATAVTDATVSIETGCGASTVVFAAAGSDHVVVTPAADEFERVLDHCRSIGVDTSRLKLIEGYSDQVLPRLGPAEYDFVLIDGAHCFPVPALDFHYLSRRLRIGGLLLLDDAWIPSVAGVFDYLSAEPSWEQLAILDRQAVLWRRVAEDVCAGGDFWRAQGMNRSYPDYSFLPLPDRLWPRARKELLRARDLIVEARMRRT